MARERQAAVSADQHAGAVQMILVEQPPRRDARFVRRLRLLLRKVDRLRIAERDDPSAVGANDALTHVVAFMEALEFLPRRPGDSTVVAVRTEQPQRGKMVVLLHLVYEGGDFVVVHEHLRAPGAFAFSRDNFTRLGPRLTFVPRMGDEQRIVVGRLCMAT